MSDIKVKVGQQNSLKLRVGQQNAVKVISSISGSASGQSVTAENVIGGIGSIRELHVSGISTFVGVSTFKSNVFIDGDLYIGDDLVFDEFTARNGRITGIATITGGFYYGPYYTNGIPYFNSMGLMVSTASPENGIDYTNYIMTTDNAGTPAWSNAIDGGFY
jgi:hypothetical protein